MLSRLKTAFGRGGGESASEKHDRLEAVVARQRGLRAAAVQERLSHQQTDPFSEAATPALYNASVYASSEPAPEEEPEQ